MRTWYAHGHPCYGHSQQCIVTGVEGGDKVRGARW